MPGYVYLRIYLPVFGGWKEHQKKIQNTSCRPSGAAISIALNAHQIDRPALILRRTVDGYIDATSTCRAVGKKFGHYLANQAT